MNFDFDACSHCNGKKESYESAEVYRQESSLAASTVAVLAGVVVAVCLDDNGAGHGVSAKAGLWTLDWTMDWTMDWNMDSILDSFSSF